MAEQNRPDIYTQLVIASIRDGFDISLTQYGYGFKMFVVKYGKRGVPYDASVVLPFDHLTEQKLFTYLSELVAAVAKLIEAA